MSTTDDRASSSPGAHDTQAPGEAARPPRRSWPLRLSFLGIATLGWTGIRPVAWFNLSDGFFLAAIGLIAARMLQGSLAGLAAHAMRRSPPLLLQGAILLLAASAVSSLASWNPAASIGETVRLAYLTLVWFWALRTVCPDISSFLHLIKGWKLLVLLTALSGFYGQLVGGEAYIQNEHRLVGFAEHPNALGAALSVGLPIVLFAAHVPDARLDTRSRWWRIALSAVGIVVLLQSGSISSSVAAVAGVAAAAGCRVLTSTGHRPAAGGRSDRINLGPLLGAFVGLIGLAFLLSTTNPVAERLSLVNEEGTNANYASVDIRERLNQHVFETLDDRILVGVGLDAQSSRRDLPADIPERLGIHNFYLRLVHEAGMPAALAVLGMNLYAAHRALVLAVQWRDPVVRSTAAAMLGALVAANVGAQFQPIGFVRYYWLPVAMITCLWMLVRTQGRTGPTDGRAVHSG